jgi:hypothetical protein
MMDDEKDRMMFLEEDSGGGELGGGGGEAEAESRGGESRAQAVFDEPQEARGGHEGPREGQDQRQARPAVPAAPVIDARAFANEFGQVIGQHFRPPPKEMTAEEAKRLLNVWEPTQEWLAKYDNLESRNHAIAEMRDGLIRQSDTITQYRMREMMAQMQQAYGPVVQHMHVQQARAGESRFGEAYPELAAEGLRPLKFAVAQNLLAQRARFRSEREMFHAIASGVEAVIKVSNPEFKLNGGGGGTPTPAKRKSGPIAAGGIPVTTPGSGGGAGPKGQGPPKPRGLAIFDP